MRLLFLCFLFYKISYTTFGSEEQAHSFLNEEVFPMLSKYEHLKDHIPDISI
jgi:hypothetical protein